MMSIWSLCRLPDLVVVGVVGRGDLDAAAAELGLGPVVLDQRDHALLQRQRDLAPVGRHLGDRLELREVRGLALAQPLEEAGKIYGDTRAEANILVSSSVRAALVQPLAFEHLGAHKLRGREEQVEIYRLHRDDEE